MAKIRFFIRSNWKILGLIVLLASCFSLVYFFHDQIPVVDDAKLSRALPIAGLKTMPLPNTTFLKSYRLLVSTRINGAWPTKDGGYIVSGTTNPNVMFIPPDGFVAKLDKQGNIQWVKFLKTKNSPGAGSLLNPRGDEDVQSIIELKNGGYLMASKVWGFITVKEFDAGIEVNKILLTKLDKNGNMIWNKSFNAFVEDAKNSLLETNDNGLLFYANITDLAPNKRGEDSEVYYDQPYSSLKIFQFDQNGNIQWSKNIKNFISRKNDSYLIQAPDGGYALAGNFAETNSEKDPPYNYDTYPGLAKFDKNFNFEWAKSLEGIPYEMAAAVPNPDGGFEIGSQKLRQGASNIRGLIKTQDNGYLVLGNLSAALSLMTDSMDLKSGLPHSYLIGFKFDSEGNLERVKKITLGFNIFGVPMLNFSVSSTADRKLMFVGPITWADDDYQAKVQNVNVQRKWYSEKYGEAEILKDDSKKTAQSRQDWKKVQAAIKAVQDAFREGIFMMKTDQELNISWAKVVNTHRGTANYVLKATADSGAIIAGEYETNVVQSASYGSITYYKDGFLIKLDASGNVKNNAGWVINYNDKIVTEIMTPYAISNDLSARVVPYSINLTKREPEFSLYKKAKTTVYAPFNSSKDTLYPQSPTVSAYDAPLQNSTDTSTAKRTWPQINYEGKTPVEPTNEKSQTIHDELMPILNQLYNDQVKLTDNMGGAMLSYVFDRIVTKDDMTAVKDYLENQGYKTQDEGTYQLTMYKPGYFLILTFSMNHTDKAFLEVTY
ncbi:MAG: hypothetical protein PHW01_02800 [Patescibacteria group bacterium]|nr:hypothetical protein [Patescibacteria group bacterium]